MRRTNLVGVSILCCIAWAAAGAVHEDGAFIGWNGESYRPTNNDKTGPGAKIDKKRWIETISWSPRAFVYHNFLTEEEVNHIVALVEHTVSRSQVVDTTTGKHTLDNIRTSYGAALGRGQDPVIAGIEAKIAEWTQLPADHQEPIQVLRYQNGQKYDAHWDWFDDPTHPATSGENRVATVLMYLGDVEEGGETALPLGKFIDQQRQMLTNPSECVNKGSGMAVKPVKGDALLFWDMHVDGTTVDRASLHASCPTLKGTKWTATKWIHNRPYGAGYDALKAAASCKDISSNCASMVAEGKCDSEPATMLGLKGLCRKSCNDCIECDEHDLICLRKNMRSLRQQHMQQGQQAKQPGMPSQISSDAAPVGATARLGGWLRRQQRPQH